MMLRSAKNRSIIFLLLTLCVVRGYSQLPLFGTDVSKHFFYPDSVYYKKFNCSVNPYFTVGEYKDMGDMKLLLFGNYTAKSQTPQMKNPAKYTGDLKNYICKVFGTCIPLFTDSALTRKNEDEYLWIKKYKTKYLVGTLHFTDEIMPENDFRIMIYDSFEKLKSGVEYIYGGLYSWRVNFYDEKIIDGYK